MKIKKFVKLGLILTATHLCVTFFFTWVSLNIGIRTIDNTDLLTNRLAMTVAAFADILLLPLGLFAIPVNSVIWGYGIALVINIYKILMNRMKDKQA